MDFLTNPPVLLGFGGTTAAIVAAVASVVSAVSAVAGGVVSAIGQKQQGEAANQAAKYNAAVAQNEAIMAQNAAAAEARQIRRRNMLRLGAQRAAIGKSGVSLDAGSSFDDVIFDSSIQGELEAQSVLYAGLVRSRSQMAAGAMSLYEGRQAKRAAGIGMAGSAIGALGGIAQAGYMSASASMQADAAKAAKPVLTTK